MDLIDRKRVIKEVRREMREQENSAILGEDIDIGVIVGLKMATQIIKEQPAAEDTGVWINNIDDGWRCSNCDCSITPRYGKYSYCPYCGAKMEG